MRLDHTIKPLAIRLALRFMHITLFLWCIYYFYGAYTARKINISFIAFAHNNLMARKELSTLI